MAGAEQGARVVERNLEAGVAARARTRTLAIDIGGTGLKALVLDERGEKLTERVRVETPQTRDARGGASRRSSRS